jgi:hypothetical protein
MLAVALQLAMMGVALRLSGTRLGPPFPPPIVAALVAWPALLLCTDEAIRHHDRKRARKTQQRLTLEFETLLGQTSPK